MPKRRSVLARLKPKAKVPPRLAKALKRGAKVELEHTRSRKAAEVIASHHLAEFGARYYPALAKMERKLARGNPPQNLNAAFYKWFGKSVLTAKDGQPLPLYHGTSTAVNFDRFKVSDGSYGQGIYLAPAWHASTYAEGHGGRVIPVYARVEHPFVIDLNDGDPGYKAWSDEIVANAERRASGLTVGKWLQKLGYDGVIVNDNGKLYMVNVLSPKQVKSVHNKGTWSRRTPVLVNPKMGNDPTIFRLTHARRLLAQAIIQTGGDTTNIEEIESRAYELALHRAHENGGKFRILPMKERAELRVLAVLTLAQMIASGELRGGPRRNPQTIHDRFAALLPHARLPYGAKLVVSDKKALDGRPHGGRGRASCSTTTVWVTRKLAREPAGRQVGVLMHELAHIHLFQHGKIKHTERQCDATAAKLFGKTIRYDRDLIQTTGKGVAPRPLCLPNPMPNAIELPPLIGTPKQVAWAEQIRQEAAPVVAQWLDEVRRAYETAAGARYSRGAGAASARAYEMLRGLEAGMKIADASFWIEVRNSKGAWDFSSVALGWGRPRRRGY